MIIERHTVGCGKRSQYRYSISNTPQESGKGYAEEVARFESLEIAALVFRYLNGVTLTTEDTGRVITALQSADNV